MNQTNATAADVRAALENKLTHFFGVSTDEATFAQVYGSVILTVRDILSQKKDLFHRRRKTQQAKKIYYLCMEFLIGPSLDVYKRQVQHCVTSCAKEKKNNWTNGASR